MRVNWSKAWKKIQACTGFQPSYTGVLHYQLNSQANLELVHVIFHIFICILHHLRVGTHNVISSQLVWKYFCFSPRYSHARALHSLPAPAPAFLLTALCAKKSKSLWRGQACQTEFTVSFKNKLKLSFNQLKYRKSFFGFTGASFIRLAPTKG